jgi:nicotinate-nucleotide pyrophosphorylase (carboxylating)
VTDPRPALLAQARQLVQMAHEEDVGRGDITSMLLPPQGQGRFHLVARQAGVFAGREIAPLVIDAYDAAIQVEWTEHGCDGASLGAPPVVIAHLSGAVASILTAERVLLNFLQRLSGIATKTRQFVDVLAGTSAVVLDTRKTTPGWRHLEKYAVRCGGGRNHRFGLHDAVLIKDNHLAPFPAGQTASAVFDMLNRMPALDPPPIFVEVEADCLAQVDQLLKVVGVDVVMLDNFTVDHVRQAVVLRRDRGLDAKVKFEVSGGVTLATARGYAEAGVDFISVGALTHSATALDLALDRVA